MKAKKRYDGSAGVVLKYVLLQIPAAALVVVLLMVLREWLDFPLWVAWAIMGVWIGKDIALFPFVWRSYDRHRPGDPFSMVGEKGIAEERLDPHGYARVHGELWKVEVTGNNAPVGKGEAIRIQEVRGLILMVQPERRFKEETL
jgi:membrane protein implicated in regulation of membrane protease activity